MLLFTGLETIHIPWIAVPDVLAEKKYLLDANNLDEWMRSNRLYRSPSQTNANGPEPYRKF